MGCAASVGTMGAPPTADSPMPKERPVDLVSDELIAMFRNLCLGGQITSQDVSVCVSRTAVEVTRAQTARLFWPLQERGWDQLVCIADARNPEIVKVTDGAVGESATLRKPVRKVGIGADSFSTPGSIMSEKEAKSGGTVNILCVPILGTHGRHNARRGAKERVVGVLEVSRNTGSFSSEDEMKLQSVTKAVSALITKYSFEVFRAHYGEDNAEAQGMLDLLSEFGARSASDTIKRAKRKLRVAAKIIGMTTPKGDGPLSLLESGDSFVMPPVPPTGVPEMEQLKSWGMQVLHLEREQMAYCFQMCLGELGILKEFKVPPKIAFNYAQAILQRYTETPYHNMHHGFMVFQGVFCLLVEASDDERSPVSKLEPLEKFVLMVAALGHDAGHDGVNNGFHVQSGSDLALRYNDQSPLEMMHASSVFDVVKLPHCNVLEKLNKDQRGIARKVIIGSILHTDMKLHSGVETLLRDTTEFKDTTDDHQNICNVVLHAVDLNNVAVAWEVAKPWAQRVGQEFNNQYNRELQLGLQPSGFMHVPSDVKLAALQIGYITYVALPFFKLVAGHFPAFERALLHVETNVERWKDFKAEKEAEATTLATPRGNYP